ncbi:MAG: type transport system ATP-binding protein [Mycobacterium sp.]|nr:type transport system ATP-binding protein [Mycobacterium sp.]
MGAGAFVGRIGGLAVALGIGAAVFTGQGVASAEPSDSPSAQAGASTDSSATAPKAPSASSPSAAETPSRTDTSDAPTDPDPTGTDAATTVTTATATATKHSGDRPNGKRPAGSLLDRPVQSKQSTREPTLRAPSSTAGQDGDEHGTPAKRTDEKPSGKPSVADAAPKVSVASASASASTVAGIDPTPAAEEVPTAQVSREPADVLTAGVSSLVGSLVNSFTGDTPTAPADPPMAWTLLAATRRETFGTAPTLAKSGTPVTNSLAVADVASQAVALADPVPAPVVAIPQVAPLEGLQRLPVIGPLLLTPIVTIIHQIPLIGDILHPLLGYPLQVGLPAGTPVPRDVKVVSFDGTQIYVHFFPATGLPAATKAPTILDGPGLALPGATTYLSEKDEFLPNDVIGIGALRNAGYNVVTWDPRGEWNSGGQLEVDSPDFEAKDVSAIISWLATQPEVQLDHPENLAALDPRIGMVGASYGGGIQLVTAAVDHRVDAIVPTIAWHSLNTSLDKNQAFKSSWGTLLVAALAGTFARPNPALYPAAIYGDLTGLVTPADQDLLADRGPGDLVGNITAPTLLIQGTVDTLFTLAEADGNATALIGNGVDTKVVWFCGGHGSCVSSVNDGVLVQQSTLNWLAHYVKGDTTVDTGPQFEWVDQHGTQLSSDTYPVANGTPLVASSTAGGVLPLVPFIGGSGPQPGVLLTGPIGALLGLSSGAAAANAYNLTTPAATTTTYVVGAPQLTFTYSGIGTSRHVYAQLVDDTTGLVLGNLVTPIPVTLDGQSHQATFALEEVAQTLEPGETLTLQLVASAVPYETINSLGLLNISSVHLTLPTADPAAVTVTAT